MKDALILLAVAGLTYAIVIFAGAGLAWFLGLL